MKRSTLSLVGLVCGALLACDDPTTTTPNAPGLTLAPVRGHRGGVDEGSVLGCFEGCVDMRMDLAAMTNPKAIAKLTVQLAAKQDQCLGMFEMLPEDQRYALEANAYDVMVGCLGEKLPCYTRCQTIGDGLFGDCPPEFELVCTTLSAAFTTSCRDAVCPAMGECRDACEVVGKDFTEACWEVPTPYWLPCEDWGWQVTDICRAYICAPTCEERCGKAANEALIACQSVWPYDPACFEAAYATFYACNFACCEDQGGNPDGSPCELPPTPSCGDGVCDPIEATYCAADCAQFCMEACNRDAEDDFAACWTLPYPESDACAAEVWKTVEACISGCARCGDDLCSPGEHLTCQTDCPWGQCESMCWQDGWQGVSTCEQSGAGADCYLPVEAGLRGCLNGCCSALCTGPDCDCELKPSECGDRSCDWYEDRYCIPDCPWLCQNRCETGRWQDFEACWAAPEFAVACFDEAMLDYATCSHECCLLTNEVPDQCVEQPAPQCGNGVCEAWESDYCAADCGVWTCENLCYRTRMDDEAACWKLPPEQVDACLQEVWAAIQTCREGCAECGDGYCTTGEGADCLQDCPDYCYQQCDQAFYPAFQTCLSTFPLDLTCFEAAIATRLSCDYNCCLVTRPGQTEQCQLQPTPVCPNGSCEMYEAQYCAADCGPDTCHELCWRRYEVALKACYAGEVDPAQCVLEVEAATQACHAGCDVCGDGFCSGNEPETCLTDCPWACDYACERAFDSTFGACLWTFPLDIACFEAAVAARLECAFDCCLLVQPDPGACMQQPTPSCPNDQCEVYEWAYCVADCGPQACHELCWRQEELAYRACETEPDPATCMDNARLAAEACHKACDVCGDGYCTGNEPQECPTDCPWCGDGICQPGEEGWCPDCPCGNGVCEPGEEGWCPDCSKCGNGICESGEQGVCADCPIESQCKLCVEPMMPSIYECTKLPVTEQEACFLMLETKYNDSCYGVCCWEQCTSAEGCPPDTNCEVPPPPAKCGDGQCTGLEVFYCTIDPC